MKPHPKVAIIGTRGYPSYYGGFETAVRHLVPALVSRGMRVTVYSRRGYTVKNKAQANSRVRNVFTPYFNTNKFSTLSHGFISSLHACVFRPDVALVMNVANGYWLPMLRIAGIPIIMNVDGMEWERGKWNKFAKLVFKTGAKLSAKFSSLIVCDSQVIRENWKEKFSVEGMFIPYGSLEVDDVPGKIISTKDHVVLWVARLVPENSLENFLDAVSLLPSDVKILIVGSNKFDLNLESRVLKLQESRINVTWIKQISDELELNRIWRDSMIYFHGHSVGGTNPALVQAMRSGAAIVALDTTYNREVCESAAIYTSANPKDIADQIAKLISDNVMREKLRYFAQERAKKKYDWGQVCESYIEAIMRVTR